MRPNTRGSRYDAHSLATALAMFLMLATVQTTNGEASIEELREQAQGHWAFQPLAIASGEEPRQTASVDRLVAAKRNAAGLTPQSKADRRTLVRRLYLHLIGLPPTPAEVSAVVDSSSAKPLADLVDDLLARPEFGERWGRHWLDVARYADSNGCSIEANNTYDNAWRYRDYVIASFNEDKPIDKFVVEQVAGDLLEATTDYRRAEQLIATGFLMLGPKAFGTGSFQQLRLDAVDDQLDTIGKAFLGLSIGCARCHDHKLEPISTDEYYSMAGIFGSTTTVIHQAGWRSGRTWNRVPLPGLDEETSEALKLRHQQQLEAAREKEFVSKSKEALAKLKQELEQLEGQEKSDKNKIASTRKLIERAELKVRNAKSLAKVLPVVSPVPAAMAAVDVREPTDEAVRYGGDPGSKGEIVAREVLAVPNPQGRQRYQIPADQSGRLQLARWLVDSQDGAGQLTARVFANRVWHHLFGSGIVPTTDNFGFTGQPPTNPELLDFLAASLIEDDWSVKRLVRRIVLSDTYQLDSGHDPSNAEIDPANRLHWRHTPRRMEVEAMRDSVLAISGQLDHTRGGKTLQHLGLITIGSDMIHLDTPSPYNRRTVYLPIIRDALGISSQIDSTSVMLTAFDGAPPNLVCGNRDTSVVPTQSLFLMNSDFVAKSASHTAKQILADSQLGSDAQRVGQLFQLLLGRPATEPETTDAMKLVRSLESQSNSQAGSQDPSKTQSGTAQSNRELMAWSGLCQALFSSHEFLFVK